LLSRLLRQALKSPNVFQLGEITTDKSRSMRRRTSGDKGVDLPSTSEAIRRQWNAAFRKKGRNPIEDVFEAREDVEGAASEEAAAASRPAAVRAALH